MGLHSELSTEERESTMGREVRALEPPPPYFLAMDFPSVQREQ